MRIENAEKVKLEGAPGDRPTEAPRLSKQPATGGAGRLWESVPVLYIPYYAYEELMAAFRDEPGFGALDSRLGGAPHATDHGGATCAPCGSIPSCARSCWRPTKEQRPALPEPAAAGVRGGVYVAYRRREDSGRVARIYDALAASLGSDRVLMDVGTEPGVDFVDSDRGAPSGPPRSCSSS